MKEGKSLVLKAALACTMVFVGLSAQALTIADSASFTNVLTELDDQPLRVNRFDPGLGELTSVTVTLSAELTSTGTVTNTAAQVQNFSVSTRVQDFNGDLSTGGPSVLPDAFQVVENFSEINSQRYPTLSQNQTVAFGPGTFDTGVQEIFSSSDFVQLTEFKGTDVFGYDFTTLLLTVIGGGGGNIISQIETVASATLDVVYTYDERSQPPPIPEPGTLALLGLGMVGLATLVRKRMPQ